MNNQLAEVLVYLSAMWRRRWLAIVVATATCIVGWIAVATIPNTYDATARIYVDTETVLRPLLRGLAVDDNIEDEVKIMQQTLLTRPNLTKVARATDLDLTLDSPAQMELLIDSMRERTNIEASGTNLFSIAFKDQNPVRAKEAVQSLLNIFMESHLGESRNEMDSAQEFIDDQIADYQRLLDEAEKRLAEFKQKNLRLLPGPRGYEQRLESMREGYFVIESALEDARTEQQVLSEQLAMIPSLIETGSQGGSGPPSDYALRIVELEASLDQLLPHFTDQHPDVVALRRRISELKAEERAEFQAMLAANEASSGAGPLGDGGADQPTMGVPNPAYSQLRLMVAEKEAQVARLEEQAARALEKLSELESMALEVPVVEANLKRLTRDYDVIKKQYETLLSRRESAKISRESDVRGKKVQFRIVEPPRAPIMPSGPNRPVLLSAVLPLGLGLGAAFAFALAFLSDTFAGPRRLSDQYGVPVLGTISRVERATDRKMRIADLVAWLGALVGLVVLYVILMVVESQVGLGKVVQAAGDARSVGDLITVFTRALSQAFAPL